MRKKLTQKHEQGAYGKVYLAKWRGLEVAVKKFRKQVLTSENTHKIQHEVNLMRCALFTVFADLWYAFFPK